MDSNLSYVPELTHLHFLCKICLSSELQMFSATSLNVFIIEFTIPKDSVLLYTYSLINIDFPFE